MIRITPDRRKEKDLILFMKARMIFTIKDLYINKAMAQFKTINRLKWTLKNLKENLLLISHSSKKKPYKGKKKKQKFNQSFQNIFYLKYKEK